jgi:hypothetical protein
MAGRHRKAPEGADRRAEIGEDTEGHGSGRQRLDVKHTAPADEPGAGPQTTVRGRTDEEDVEGHNFGHNSMISRNAAQSREREIQQNLRQHDVKTEARRPFFKKGS